MLEQLLKALKLGQSETPGINPMEQMQPMAQAPDTSRYQPIEQPDGTGLGQGSGRGITPVSGQPGGKKKMDMAGMLAGLGQMARPQPDAEYLAPPEPMQGQIFARPQMGYNPYKR